VTITTNLRRLRLLSRRGVEVIVRMGLFKHPKGKAFRVYLGRELDRASASGDRDKFSDILEVRHGPLVRQNPANNTTQTT
jgi:hypothetical protein